LKVSARCGCSPNACQIRKIAFCVKPASAAIDRVDQCVAFLGVVSNVLTTTSSTWSSVIVGGRPGRGSSTRPSSLRSANRVRHFPTVGRDTPTRSAISVFVRPSAACSTIRDRRARPWALVVRRVHASKHARSSSLNSISAATGRGMITASPYCKRIKPSGH
jgi:hypothetical protein